MIYYYRISSIDVLVETILSSQDLSHVSHLYDKLLFGGSPRRMDSISYVYHLSLLS